MCLIVYIFILFTFHINILNFNNLLQLFAFETDKGILTFIFVNQMTRLVYTFNIYNFTEVNMLSMDVYDLFWAFLYNNICVLWPISLSLSHQIVLL